MLAWSRRCFLGVHEMWRWLFDYWYNHWYDDGGSTTHNVPEIDASSGLLAVAAILAALMLAWELRRRRARN